MLLLSFLFLIPSALAYHLHLTIPATTVLASPATLPPSTHAVLTTTNLTLSAPLRRSNDFFFAAIPAGDYLCEVYARDYAFLPFRVDVGSDGVKVWQTFRGNEWGNLGELVGKGEGEGVSVAVRMHGEKKFFESRGGFSVMSILKNPMILIAVFGMGMMIGMPYLLDNMDPETRKEFEETQKSSPLAGVTSGAGPMSGFDMAAWMAGKTSPTPAATTSSTATEDVSGSGNSGGGKGKGRRRG